MNNYLSPHFTYLESIHSQTASRLGIDNTPTKDVLANIQSAARSMERVREKLGKNSIIVSSWYRSPALNTRIKGSKTSAHMQGWAIDFTCPGYGTIDKVMRTIIDSGINYDQIINEYDGAWCHISFDPKNRKQKLAITSQGTKEYVWKP